MKATRFRWLASGSIWNCILRRAYGPVENSLSNTVTVPTRIPVRNTMEASVKEAVIDSVWRPLEDSIQRKIK